jgi:hypothetical protein
VICPFCERPVSEKDVTWLLGVAGHYECHRRVQATNARVGVTALVGALLTMGVCIGAFIWFVVWKK